MTHEENIVALLQVLQAHHHVIVTAHARPDGDAVGSALALAEILDQMGHDVEIVFADPVPEIYATLPNVGRIRRATRVGGKEGAVVILECDSIERTGLLDLGSRFVINIDHHASGRPYGAFNWIDENACAVAVLVYRIAEATKVDLTPSMATCLYTAVMSDTGSFTYPGTSAETFELAHTLAVKGASPSQIARDVLFTSPLSKVKLLGAALSNLECDGQIAWSWVTQQDLHRAGATPEDCEGVVNHLISIAGVESAVFLRELPSDNQFRLSIRSKGRVNVAHAAESFGGGGHRTASGCTIDGPLSSATGRILKQLRDEPC
ncbi:DHH family phosphoesterase [Granulicella arctica]|uniref:DHH family phosphoesterase n=1 Tax=Granulicella arctica TaxID=940613 RepID=UPI0021E0B6AA|nr:bifunctional oligoribonuclease/PAP phosphatase NrnA [Granulicella arctica]